jgi:diguanylate cyclase (GGDEF)-like protein
MNGISLLFVTAALSAVMLLVLSSLSRSNVEGIRAWSQANWLAVLALPLFAARGLLPDVISIELANATFMTAASMMLVGFRRHLQRPVPGRMLVVCVGLALATLAVFHFGVDSMPLRVVDMSLFHGGVCLMLGLTVRSALPNAPSRYPYIFTSVAAFALACGHAVRALVSIAQALHLSTSLDDGTWQVIFFSLGTLAMPALTLGAVMMANADIIARATYAADHDYLTGAWSRRAFFHLAERERARAERSGGELSVLLFDVDHFKLINDAHGHAVGDHVLVDIVRRTEQVVRQVDYCARVGGEEFAVLLPDAGVDTAATVAERLREALDRTMRAPGSQHEIAYSVSIGIARLEPDETITALLCRADRALYLAKAAGRNTSVCAPAAPVDDQATVSRSATPCAVSVGPELSAHQQL